MDNKEKNQNINIYHTNLRNIGLYFTLAIGIITLSGNKVIKNNFVNIILNIIGVIFLFISFLLTNELEKHNEKNKGIITKNLRNITSLIKHTMICILLLMIFSLFFL